METDLRGLTNRRIVGLEGQAISELSQVYGRKIDLESPTSILIAEEDRRAFVAVFLAGVARGIPVFLANPNWRKTEWEQVVEQMSPDLVFGKVQLPNRVGKKRCLIPSAGEILVPTGGSSGRVRFSRHCWKTLVRAVEGMRQFFAVEAVDSFCVLPLYHVSGLMPVVRSVVSGGELCLPFWRALAMPSLPSIKRGKYFISLVPTQLQRILTISEGADWLKRFRTVLLGGGFADKGLLDRARDLGVPLAPCYGMTETAGMVTALRAEDFLDGRGSVGSTLPHAEISVLGRNREDILPSGKTGRIAVRAQSLFKGYWRGKEQQSDVYLTDDEGWLDVKGYLHLRGRIDRVLITGGEKVNASEVEQTLIQSGRVSEALVIGLPDKEWGQRVVVFYVSYETGTSPEELKAQLSTHLSDYKIPKTWIPVQQLPVDEKGKPDWSQISTLVESYFGLASF